MRQLILLAFCSLLICNSSSAQIFWSENFESGSTSGTPASAYGGWTTTSTGTNDSYNNQWYVSCAENGHTDGVCGTGCVPVSATATLATLHLGANPALGGDGGATYNAGGLCAASICVVTNQRAESPVINCTGKTGITMSFNYIENGQGATDDATVWYYDGTTWSLLVNTPKTAATTCSPQGRWTHYSIALPASADNNANVKIGFNWTNNDDGAGSDPSFAVDSIALSASGGGTTITPAMTTSATTVCEDSCIWVTNTSTGTVDSFRWVATNATISTPTTSPASACFTAAGSQTVKLYLYSGGAIVDSASTSITVNPAPSPVISMSGDTLSVPAIYTSYQWVNGTTPITGATNATYVYSVNGTYAVIVDSAGCLGGATFSTTAIEHLNRNYYNFRLVQLSDNSLGIFSSQVLKEDLQIDIYDITGRVIHSTTWHKGSDSRQLSNLFATPGLYLVRLSSGQNAHVLKWRKD